MAAIDILSVQIGGVTTGRWNGDMRLEDPAVLSWPLNSHWLVTSEPAEAEECRCAIGSLPTRVPVIWKKWDGLGAESYIPPIVLRRYVPLGSGKGMLVKMEGEYLFITMKLARDNNSIILGLQNLSESEQQPTVLFPCMFSKLAVLVSLLEGNARPLQFEKARGCVNIAGRGIQPFGLLPKSVSDSSK